MNNQLNNLWMRWLYRRKKVKLVLSYKPITIYLVLKNNRNVVAVNVCLLLSLQKVPSPSLDYGKCIEFFILLKKPTQLKLRNFTLRSVSGQGFNFPSPSLDYDKYIKFFILLKKPTQLKLGKFTLRRIQF